MIRYNLSQSDTLKAVQFVFAFILKSVIFGYVLKIVSFGEFKIVFRNPKKTTLPNLNKPFVSPLRKVFLCKFSDKVVNH